MSIYRFYLLTPDGELKGAGQGEFTDDNAALIHAKSVIGGTNVEVREGVVRMVKAPSDCPEHAKPQVSDETYSIHWDDVTCPQCGKTGRVKWEKGSSTEKHLIGIVGDFYERLSKSPPYDIQLVCSGCGTVQPLRVCTNPSSVPHEA